MYVSQQRTRRRKRRVGGYAMSSPPSSLTATAAGSSNNGIGSSIIPSRAQRNGQNNHKKQPRQILPEQQYQSTLLTIVQRDYYPALPSLHRDLAVLDRRSVGDVAGAVAVRRAYRKVALEEERAADAEREEDERARLGSGGAAAVVGVRKRPRPLERETVTGFHDRATSEDNEEFDRVSRRQEAERVERVKAVFGAGLGKGGKALLRLQNGEDIGDTTTNESSSRNKILGAETPLLPASEEFDAPVTRVADASKRADATEKNSLFFVPEHYPHRQRDEADSITRDVPLLERPKDNTATDKTSLMLPPPPRKSKGSDPSSSPRVLVPKDKITDTSAAQQYSKLDLVEFKPKPDASCVEDVGIRAVPTINPAMTRFPHQGESRLPPASSGRRQMIMAEPLRMNGSDHPSVSSDTDATTDLDATPMSLAGERAARADAIAREREQYVAMTPVIVPGGGGRGAQDGPNASPIITWGTVAGTPLVLSGQKTSVDPSGPTAGPIDDSDLDESGQIKSFALPKEDSIQATARFAEARLADRARTFREAQSSRKRSGEYKEKRGSSKKRHNSSVVDRAQSLTPAARALLARNTPKTSGILSSSSSLSGAVSARSSSALASALRPSYTPLSSSRTLSKSRKAAKASATAAATPRNGARAGAGTLRASTDIRSERSKRSGANITDGLLKM